MTSNRCRTAIATLISLSVLGACGQSANDLNAAHNMSCTQLARKLGRLEQRSESAGIDGVMNGLESSLASDGGDTFQAGVRGLINDVDEVDADQSIEQLTQIYRAKGCH